MDASTWWGIGMLAFIVVFNGGLILAGKLGWVKNLPPWTSGSDN